MTRPLNPGEPEEKPSWLYPLILTGITLAIGAVILWSFLGPSLDDITGAAIRPTSDSDAYQVVLGERRFDVPGNYIRLPSSRRAGPASELELDALLPDLHGFASGEDDEIRDVSRNSRLVSITLKIGMPKLTERERFERIYQKNADPGKPPYDVDGFTATPMDASSGYAGQQVFTREDDGHFALLTCTADDPESESAGLCMREMPWGSNLTAIYSFRSGRLKEWNDLDQSVKALLMRFEPAASQSSNLEGLFRQVDVEDRHVELVRRLAVLDVFRHDADEVRAEIDLGRILQIGARPQLQRIVAERRAQIGFDALHVLAVHEKAPGLKRIFPQGGSFWRAGPQRSSDTPA
jgi:hypothetical protein